jgi:hypothetical protein
MSAPSDQPPSAPTESQADLPTRRRSGNADGSGEASGAVASADDAPAPPRRGRRGAGAAAGAVTAAAATAAAAPIADPPAPPAPPAASPKRDAAPAPAPAPAPASSAPLPSSPPKTGGRRASRRASSAPITATSEADAEAVLVDDSDVKPAKRSREPRTASASVSVPIVSSAPVAPVAPVTPAPVSSGIPTVVTAGVGRPERYYRQTVTKVDLWSVTKLSLCFYLSAMFVTIVAFVALYVIAAAAGIVKSVEKFLGDLLSAKNFHFLSGTVLRGGILLGLVIVMLQVVITVIAASFYNIFAELFGGVEITVKEDASSE